MAFIDPAAQRYGLPPGSAPNVTIPALGRPVGMEPSGRPCRFLRHEPSTSTNKAGQHRAFRHRFPAAGNPHAWPDRLRRPSI